MITDAQMIRFSKGIAIWMSHLAMSGEINTQTLRTFGKEVNMRQLYSYMRMAEAGLFDNLTPEALQNLKTSEEEAVEEAVEHLEHTENNVDSNSEES